MALICPEILAEDGTKSDGAMFAFFICSIFNPERIIHMNEEITLIVIHILIVFTVEQAGTEVSIFRNSLIYKALP